jgi:hypothetical protein
MGTKLQKKSRTRNKSAKKWWLQTESFEWGRTNNMKAKGCFDLQNDSKL